jgi:hypothetical protein
VLVVIAIKSVGGSGTDTAKMESIELGRLAPAMLIAAT